MKLEKCHDVNELFDTIELNKYNNISKNQLQNVHACICIIPVREHPFNLRGGGGGYGFFKSSCRDIIFFYNYDTMFF